MTSFFLWFQKYGLLITLLNCWGLLSLDLSPKTALTDLDIDVSLADRSGDNVFKQLSWLFPLCLYLLFSMKRDLKSRVLQDNFLLFLGFSVVVLTCLSSFFWSDFPWLTFKRVVFQAVFVSTIGFGVFYAIKHGSLVSCINLLFYSVLIICFITVLVGIGFQDGVMFAWANTKNNFGSYILSLIALFCLSRYLYEDELQCYWLKLSILSILLVASQSKTSIAIALLLVSYRFIPYFFAKFFFIFLIISLSFLFLVLPLASSWFGSYWDISFLMEPETLTGRGLIWDSLYYGLSDAESFLTGHGYGAYFGTNITPYALDDAWSYIRFINSAHNGYIELLLQVGSVLGLFIMFVMYKLVSNTENSVCFLIASVVLIHNITESSVIRDQHVIWALLVLLVFIGNFYRSKNMSGTLIESEVKI